MHNGDKDFEVKNPDLFRKCYESAESIYSKTNLRTFGRECFESVSLSVICAAYLILEPRYCGDLSVVDDMEGYIYTGLKNQCINFKKKLEKMKLDITPEEEGAYEITSESEGITDKLVLDGVSRLPPRRRQVIELYYFEDLKIRDIAERLGISEDTVKEHKSLALKSLKRSLNLRYWQFQRR